MIFHCFPAAPASSCDRCHSRYFDAVKKVRTCFPFVARMRGVMNCLRKPRHLRSEGLYQCRKLMIKPLMWEPSASWSAMIITLPYRSLRTFSAVYTVLRSIPRILTMFVSSSFFRTFASPSARGLRGFPLSGKTPKLSRPRTTIPATASVFAESPSVRMSVHWCDFDVPALFASSSFLIPRRCVSRRATETMFFFVLNLARRSAA